MTEDLDIRLIFNVEETAEQAAYRRGQEEMREAVVARMASWLAAQMRMSPAMAEKYAAEIISDLPIKRESK